MARQDHTQPSIQGEALKNLNAVLINLSNKYRDVCQNYRIQARGMENLEAKIGIYEHQARLAKRLASRISSAAEYLVEFTQHKPDCELLELPEEVQEASASAFCTCGLENAREIVLEPIDSDDDE